MLQAKLGTTGGLQDSLFQVKPNIGDSMAITMQQYRSGLHCLLSGMFPFASHLAFSLYSAEALPHTNLT